MIDPESVSYLANLIKLREYLKEIQNVGFRTISDEQYKDYTKMIIFIDKYISSAISNEIGGLSSVNLKEVNS